MFNFSELDYVQIEITNNCQASCPMCPRMHDGSVNPKLLLSAWTLDEYKTIISPEVINQVRFLEFCGNFGDPVMNKDLFEMCKYTRDISKNISITIKTNGGIRSTEWWHEFATVGATVVFAIDGLEDTNHLYRVGTDFDKIIENATSFINNGGIAHWDFLIFEHNEHQTEYARQLSKQLGFKKFFPKATSRFRQTDEGILFPVKDKLGNKLYDLKPYSKNNIKFISKDMILRYKDIVEQAVIECKSCKTNEVYIDSNKHLYPCVFTGKVLYNVNDDLTSTVMTAIVDQFNQLLEEIGGIEKLNAIHGIRNIIDSDFWQTIWDARWQNTNKLIVCAKSCDTSFLKEYYDKHLYV